MEFMKSTSKTIERAICKLSKAILIELEQCTGFSLFDSVLPSTVCDRNLS